MGKSVIASRACTAWQSIYLVFVKIVFLHFITIDCHESASLRFADSRNDGTFDKSARNDKNAIFFNDKNNRLPRSFHSLAMTIKCWIATNIRF
ncbi:hypothetical protein [Helicobacter sp. T3_23-1056]